MKKEIELKLALSPAVARKLLKAKNFKHLQVDGPTRRRLVSTYFDTPRHMLRKSGIALRVRDDGERRAQTVKLPADGTPGLTSRNERTLPVSGDRPVLAQLLEAGVAPGLGQRRPTDLHAVFTTDVERTSLTLKTRRAEVEFAIDQGVIRAGANGGAKEEAVCEAEFELLSGDASVLLDLALDVCESYDARPAHLTKSDRGYALARPSLRPRPEKARPVVLSSDMTAGDAFQAIIRDTLEHLLRNQAPTLAGHPDGVHQTRVAMRRLRAALQAFKRLLPYHERKAFNGEFRWFQQRLAPARDWHVFLRESLPLLVAENPSDTRQVARLRRLGQNERRRATKAALEHLESRRYARLILKFQRWVAGLESDAEDSELNRPAVPFARRVLRETRRELLEEKRPLKQLPPEALHDVRKRGKKARYATEFFGSLWAGNELQSYLGTMEELQDRLGESNDASVAIQLLCGARPGRIEPDVLEPAQRWSQARATERIAAAQPAWRRFRRAKAFWNGKPKPASESDDYPGRNPIGGMPNHNGGSAK